MTKQLPPGAVLILNEFLSAWTLREWERMAGACQVSRGTNAGDLETSFGHVGLQSFKIWREKRIGRAMSAIRATLDLELPDGKLVQRRITPNIIYESPSGRPLARDTAGGRWGVNEISALRMV